MPFIIGIPFVLYGAWATARSHLVRRGRYAARSPRLFKELDEMQLEEVLGCGVTAAELRALLPHSSLLVRLWRLMTQRLFIDQYLPLTPQSEVRQLFISAARGLAPSPDGPPLLPPSEIEAVLAQQSPLRRTESFDPSYTLQRKKERAAKQMLGAISSKELSRLDATSIGRQTARAPASATAR